MSIKRKGPTGVIAAEDFDTSLIPHHLKKEAKKVIEAAVALGWTPHVTAKNAMTIQSPDGTKSYYFGAGGRSTIPPSRIMQDVIRRADPAKVAIADSLLGMPKKEAAKIIASSPEAKAVKSVVAPKKEAKPKEQPVEVPTPQVLATSKRTLVSVEPMIAKSGENKGYPSKTTLVRTWSDDTVDYKCTQCEYTGKIRGAVPSHFATVHSRGKGRAVQPKGVEADVSDARTYRPRPARIEALAEVLAGLMKDGEKDPETIARTALIWVHENPRQRDPHDNLGEIAVEEATPDQILDHIRELLDAGQTNARIADLEQRLAESEAKIEAAEEKARKARGTLQAFIEMAQSEADEEQAS